MFTLKDNFTEIGNSRKMNYTDTYYLKKKKKEKKKLEVSFF